MPEVTIPIKQAGDTAANLASDNPTAYDKQFVLETDTLKFKVGDGVTAYNDLSYFNNAPDELTADELAAIQGAAAPSGANVFATMADVGGIPAGSDTWIQFNDSGAFGASPYATWSDGLKLISGQSNHVPLWIVAWDTQSGNLLQITNTAGTNKVIVDSDYNLTLVDGVFIGDGSGLTNLPATSPAGSDTQIQFNDGGSFGASSNLSFSSNYLNIGDTSGGSTSGISFRRPSGGAELGRVTGANSALIWNMSYPMVVQGGFLGLGVQDIPDGQLHIRNEGDDVAQIITLANSQTANAFEINSFGNTGGDLVQVDSDGRLGIGTSTPNAASKLDVNGNIWTNGYIYSNGSGIRGREVGIGYGPLGLNAREIAGISGDLYINATYATQKLGIGLIAPSAKIHIQNSVTTDVAQKIDLANSQTANAFEINSSGGSGGNVFRVESDGSSSQTSSASNLSHKLLSSAEARVSLFSSGSVDSKSALTYYVNGGALGSAYAELGLNNSYNSNSYVGGAIAFDSRSGISPIRMFTKKGGSNTAKAFEIDANGNVGIGTTPTARLHVKNSDTTLVGQKIDLANSQSANAFEINSFGGSGGDLISVLSDGKTGFGIIAPIATVDINGSIATKYVTKTANYTITTTDADIVCTGTHTQTLHTAVGFNGMEHTVKNLGVGIITMGSTASQTIDGSAASSVTLTAGMSLTFKAYEGNWIIK